MNGPKIIIFTLFYKSVYYFFENVKPAPHPQDIKRTHTHTYQMKDLKSGLM